MQETADKLFEFRSQHCSADGPFKAGDNGSGMFSSDGFISLAQHGS